MKQAISFLTGAVVLMFALCSAHAADQDHVVVEGVSTIVREELDVAREKALQNAFRRAIEQAVGVMVESRTLVSNFELLNDSIYSKSNGFIKKYSIVGERAEGDAYWIKIKALVMRMKLEKGLDSINVPWRGKPRLVMLLSEQNLDQTVPSYWWGENGNEGSGAAENVLVSNFMRKGFEFVDRQVIAASIRDAGGQAAAGSTLSNDSVLQLLSSGEADVAIIGHAQARQTAATIAGSSIRSCQGNISARAVNMDSGEVLGTCASSAVVAHLNPAAGGIEALKKAADQCSDKLIADISKWKKKLDGRFRVKLIVEGLKYDDVATLQDMLRERIGRIDEIYDRGFRENTCKLDLEASCDAREIAGELSNVEFAGGALTVNSVSANVIRISVSRK